MVMLKTENDAYLKLKWSALLLIFCLSSTEAVHLRDGGQLLQSSGDQQCDLTKLETPLNCEELQNIQSYKTLKDTLQEKGCPTDASVGVFSDRGDLLKYVSCGTTTTPTGGRPGGRGAPPSRGRGRGSPPPSPPPSNQNAAETKPSKVGEMLEKRQKHIDYAQKVSDFIKGRREKCLPSFGNLPVHLPLVRLTLAPVPLKDFLGSYTAEYDLLNEPSSTLEKTRITAIVDRKGPKVISVSPPACSIVGNSVEWAESYRHVETSYGGGKQGYWNGLLQWASNAFSGALKESGMKPATFAESSSAEANSTELGYIPAEERWNCKNLQGWQIRLSPPISNRLVLETTCTNGTKGVGKTLLLFIDNFKDVKNKRLTHIEIPGNPRAIGTNDKPLAVEMQAPANNLGFKIRASESIEALTQYFHADDTMVLEEASVAATLKSPAPALPEDMPSTSASAGSSLRFPRVNNHISVGATLDDDDDDDVKGGIITPADQLESYNKSVAKHKKDFRGIDNDVKIFAEWIKGCEGEKQKKYDPTAITSMKACYGTVWSQGTCGSCWAHSTTMALSQNVCRLSKRDELELELLGGTDNKETLAKPDALSRSVYVACRENIPIGTHATCVSGGAAKFVEQSTLGLLPHGCMEYDEHLYSTDESTDAKISASCALHTNKCSMSEGKPEAIPMDAPVIEITSGDIKMIQFWLKYHGTLGIAIAWPGDSHAFSPCASYWGSHPDWFGKGNCEQILASAEWFCDCPAPGTPFNLMPESAEQKAAAAKKGGPNHAAGHAVTVYGWECTGDADDYSKCSWLMQNSWGEDWGIKGTAKIQFGAMGAEKTMNTPVLSKMFTDWYTKQSNRRFNMFGLMIHQLGLKHVPSTGKYLFLKEFRAAVSNTSLFAQWDLASYQTVQVSWTTSVKAECSVRTTLHDSSENTIYVQRCDAPPEIATSAEGFFHENKNGGIGWNLITAENKKKVDTKEHYIGCVLATPDAKKRPDTGSGLSMCTLKDGEKGFFHESMPQALDDLHYDASGSAFLKVHRAFINVSPLENESKKKYMYTILCTSVADKSVVQQSMFLTDEIDAPVAFPLSDAGFPLGISGMWKQKKVSLSRVALAEDT